MAEALIRTNALSGWRDLLQNRGVDLQSILDVADRNTTKTTTGHDAITLAQFVDILERAAVACPQPGLAWNAGHNEDYSTRGAIGRAVLSSKTLGSAFKRLTDYFPLLQDATDLKLTVGPDWTALSYRILDPDIWPRHNDALYSLGIYSKLLKTAAPDAWRHAELSLEATSDKVECNVPEVVQANCIYGADVNCLRFPTKALDSALDLEPAEPNVLRELNKRLVRQKRQTPIVNRARHIIFREMNEGAIGQEAVASELGMTSRTLRRKLAAEKVSYQSVLDDCRMRAATLEFRTRRDVSLSETALRIGYSEHSTFSRAFARWAGMPPQEYRRSLDLAIA